MVWLDSARRRLSEGRGNCLEYLKRGSKKKKEGTAKIWKRGGQAGSRSGCLKKVGLEPPYKLWVYVFHFGVKKLFAIHLYAQSVCSSVFVNFSVQTALGVQSGWSTQWIAYSNLRKIWLLLMSLFHFLRYKCFKFWIVFWIDLKENAD